jgi:hypothetical protein
MTLMSKLCGSSLSADDNALLPLVGGDPKKIVAVRNALERWRLARPPAPPAPPAAALPAYQQ